MTVTPCSLRTGRSLHVWYRFAHETHKRAPEVELYTTYLFSLPLGSFLPGTPMTGRVLSQVADQAPRGFKEVSSFTDEAAVKRTFKSALTLQPKQVSAVGQDVRSGVSASSYPAHFLEGAVFKSSQASELLTSPLAPVKTTSKADLESRSRLALSSVEDTRSFLSHGQAVQSDVLGALTAIDVNLTLA